MACRRIFEGRLAILVVIVAVLAFARVTHQTAAAAGSPARETIVYVTKTGTKYHVDGCQYLRQSKIPMPLSQAARMYGPCSRCRPPVLGPLFAVNAD